MPERRRPLLDAVLGGNVADGIIEDMRKAARRRILDEAVGGTVRDRVDEVIGRTRGRR